MAKCGSSASLKSLPPFPAARCIPYRYCDDVYYPYGNSPANDFLRYNNWKRTRSEHAVNPSILSLGCGDIRSCLFTLAQHFNPSSVGSSKLRGISFYMNDRCDSIHARNVVFLHILLKNAWNPPRAWVPSLWSIWYCHELLPQHVEVLQDAVTDLLSLSESSDKWAKSEAPICSLCKFEEDTLSEVRSIWKIWLKRLSGKQQITLQLIKSERDKCRFRAYYLQHPSDIVFMIILKQACLRRVHDAMTADVEAYLKDGSAFAETVGAFAELSTQRVSNPTFVDKNGTYKMSCFLTPYFSFKATTSCLEQNLLREGSFVQTSGLEIHPLLSNSVQHFTMLVTNAAKVLMSRQDGNIKFYFNNLDAVVHCQKLSQLSQKFNCIDSSNLIDYLSPLVLVVAAMPLLCEGGLLLSLPMIFYEVAPSMEQYLHKMFGFDPVLLPTLFGITYSFGERILFTLTQMIWKRDIKAQPLNLDDLRTRPDIIQALVGLTKVSNADEKLFREFRMCAETAVLSYCFFASTLHFDAPIESHQFWDGLCLHLRQEDEMQKYLLQIQTQALLHNLHLHLVYSGDECPLCTQQFHSIEQFQYCFPVGIEREKLRARIRDLASPIQVQYEINCFAHQTVGENDAAVIFFWPSFSKHYLFSLESSKGSVTFPTSALVSSKVFTYSFVQVHKFTTPDFKEIAAGDSLGVEVGCSHCRKKGSTLKHCPCHLVAYCNETCQKIHWPIHKRKHKASEILK